MILFLCLFYGKISKNIFQSFFAFCQGVLVAKAKPSICSDDVNVNVNVNVHLRMLI